MSIAIFVSLVINTLSYALIVLISYRHKSFKPITTLLGASVLVDILKRIINQPRPDGATRCDAFAMKCEASPYGMPSGHVATAVVASLLVCKELHLSKTATKLITLGVFLLISWSRVKMKCHTPLQCIIGGIVGLLWTQFITLHTF